MATFIGAKIGIEGEAEYRKSIKGIIDSTRDLKAEFKEIESSIGKNKTIQDVAKQRENLNKQLQETTKILEKQKEVLDKGMQHNLDQRNNIGLDWANQKEFIPDEKFQQYQRNLLNTQTELNNTKKKLEELPTAIELVTSAFKNETSQWGEALKGVGSFMTKYVTTPIVAGAGLSVKTFADQQSAMTGVKKTVDELYDSNGNLVYSYKDIENELRNIALTTGSTFEEVAAVGEVAGQLGIATEDIGEFSRVMVMLGDSTNLGADEAATALARILNITGESTDNIEKLGNSIVYLGNNFATSESEIVHMTNRLAAGGTLAGLTTQEILGLATAMSSVGITAEAGGTAMTQTLTAIEKEFAAFTEGTDNNLARIGEIAGMSADEFAKAWKEKPAEAIAAFIGGLGDLDEKGENAVLVLDELGMSGIRQSNMLKSLALASDVLTEAIEGSNYAYEESTALTDEASKRYEDFNTKTHQLKESFKYLGSEVGGTIAEMLLPVVEKLSEFLQKMAEGWQKLPDPIKKFIVSLGGIAATIGPLLLIAGNIMIFASKIKGAMEVLGITGKVLALGIGKFALIIGGVVAAIAAAIWVFNHWDEIMEVAKNVIAAFGEALKLFGELVVEIFKFVRDWIVEKVTEIKDGIVEKFTEAKDWVILKVTEIKDGIVNFFTQAKDNAVQLFTNLKDNATTIFENMKAGIRTKVDEIKTSIVNGITNAINWIKSLPSQALSWGADIMKSMAQGIRNAMSWVTDAVSNVANRVRSFLHFSEPDIGPLSDFHTYMPDMMKLMAKGINDNAYLVEDALTNVTGMMAGNLEGNEPNNYNYGGVVINMNVPEGADGRMLVDEIESELAARTMRRKAVFG